MIGIDSHRQAVGQKEDSPLETEKRELDKQTNRETIETGVRGERAQLICLVQH